MALEMGALMTGIIMAGRTGAAFAAQIGTMQVNEEIDALRTTGLAPVEFLVLPRMLALFVMMPLLALYANLLGILGGALVGVTLLDLSWQGLHRPDPERAQPDGLRHGPHQGRGLRRAGRDGRLPARDAVRAQRRGGGRR